MIGAVAAISGFFTTIGTNTVDYSERLKRQPSSSGGRLRTIKEGLGGDGADGQAKNSAISSVQLEGMAWRMAVKTYEDNLYDNLSKPRNNRRLNDIQARIAAKKTKHGGAHQVTSATFHYVGDLTKAGLKAPVAFFYNVANGFGNMPSYLISNEVHRRRDEITGLGSGLGVAGKVCSFATIQRTKS